ncbi:outer membrane protein assembly factor BamB family protein [Sunxiuqinia sp. A32]|uniref:outer membrane protein assembly factor BamB family protein n=1 Tax=Sunxiuqinia sp. A32 TaxID=3461496 RepID=UPI0040458A5A
MKNYVLNAAIVLSLLLMTGYINAHTVSHATRADIGEAEDFPKTGLMFWVSADHVKQANDTVTMLWDRSGNNNNAYHNRENGMTMSNPKVLTDKLSGQSILNFTGEDCCFSFDQVSDVRTGFCVISKTPDAFGSLNEKCVLGGKDSHDLHTGWTNDVIYNTVVNSGHMSQYAADGKQWLNTVPIEANITPWPKQLSLFSFTTAGPVRVDQIARDRDMGGRSWQGEIAEILLFNTVLSENDRKSVEKYLLTKYAIQPEVYSNDSILPERINPKDTAEMVFVPAGEFIMGSNDEPIRMNEKPRRNVYLDSYYIYKYEVTVAQYRKFCKETNREMPVEPSWGWHDDHPIVNVTWDDAAAYASWAGAALPTEAQWEKAARGTDGSTYLWGESFTKEHCHTSDGKTIPVGQYPSGVSPYGAFDMAGNVWEWCADWYDPEYYANAPAENPPGPASGSTRVLRGGSWGFNVSEYFRVTYRNRCSTGNKYGDYGFRCVFPLTKAVQKPQSTTGEKPPIDLSVLDPELNNQTIPLTLKTTDWPQLDGPLLNCISPETGINTDWTTHKPPVLWTFKMNDGGYASSTIVKGVVYIVDHKGSDDILRALDLNTGTQLWESAYEEETSAGYGFTRGCPVYSEGKLYTYSSGGIATCFDASAGKIIWSRNLQQEYDGKKADWGYSASPFVDGEKVIYQPGGTNASVVALDKNTGKNLWQSGSDAAGHATPITAIIHGVKQYVIFNTYGAVSIRADDGTQLWRHQWITQHNCNALAPVIMGNKVFIASGYGVGCAMLDINKNWKVTEIWKNKELIARTARPILYKGYLYGTDETARLVCLNPKTGMIVWAEDGFGARLNHAWKDGFSCGSGALILVDGTLFVVSELTKSIVAVKATPEGYQELGRMELLVNGIDLFSPLAFSNGKLIARDKKNLYCVDLKSNTTSEKTKETKSVESLEKTNPTKETATTTPANGSEIAGKSDRLSAGSGGQTNWPQFRGADGSGFNPQATAPIEWDESAKKSVLWKAPIGLPGFNSPIVWGNQVFIASATSEKREVYSYSTTNGELEWTCPIMDVETNTSPTQDISEFSGYAAPTMATDGERVYAIFSNGDLAAVDFKGKLAWHKNLGVPENTYGHSTSLAVWKNKLIIQWDKGNKPGNSRMLLLDGITGKTEWEKARPVPCSWASPIVVENSGKPQIITAALPWLTSNAVDDGEELWKASVLEGEIAPSPILVDKLVYVASPNSKLVALKTDGKGDVTETHVLWECEDEIPDVTSPTSNGEIVFYVTSYGVGTCLDAKSGIKLWQHDFGEEIQASPAIAGNLIYVVSTSGNAWVFEAGREYKEQGNGVLNDKFYASPAFSNGCLYLRGNKNLYCIK